MKGAGAAAAQEDSAYSKLFIYLAARGIECRIYLIYDILFIARPYISGEFLIYGGYYFCIRFYCKHLMCFSAAKKFIYLFGFTRYWFYFNSRISWNISIKCFFFIYLFFSIFSIKAVSRLGQLFLSLSIADQPQHSECFAAGCRRTQLRILATPFVLNIF